MAATDFYTGSSIRYTETFKDVSGVGIPHSSIEDLRFVLRHSNGDSLLKYRKNAPADWLPITQETAAGAYTLEITEEQSKEWEKGTVTLEWFIKITNADYSDGYKPMGEEAFLNVYVTNYSQL